MALGAILMSRQQQEHASWAGTRIPVRPADPMRTGHPASKRVRRDAPGMAESLVFHGNSRDPSFATLHELLCVDSCSLGRIIRFFGIGQFFFDLLRGARYSRFNNG